MLAVVFQFQLHVILMTEDAILIISMRKQWFMVCSWRYRSSSSLLICVPNISSCCKTILKHDLYKHCGDYCHCHHSLSVTALLLYVLALHKCGQLVLILNCAEEGVPAINSSIQTMNSVVQKYLVNISTTSFLFKLYYLLVHQVLFNTTLDIFEPFTDCAYGFLFIGSYVQAVF